MTDPDIYDYLESNLDPEINIDENPAEFYRQLENLIPAYIIHNDEIEDYEYQYITLIRIRSNIYNTEQMFQKQANLVLDSFEEELSDLSEDQIREIEQLAEDSARYTIGNTVLVVYTMAYELIDDLMTDLLSEIYADGLQSDGLDELRGQLESFDSRQQVLYKAGVIDKSTNKQIQEIRFIRDELVHNIEPRFDLSIINDLHDIENIIYALNTLYELEHGNKAFRFVDE